MRSDRNDSVLAGLYFLSFKEKDGHKAVHWRGQVIEKISDKYYLVRLDWLVGTGSIQHTVTIEEMLEWQFYENAKNMRECYRTIVHSSSSIGLENAHSV